MEVVSARDEPMEGGSRVLGNHGCAEKGCALTKGGWFVSLYSPFRVSARRVVLSISIFISPSINGGASLCFYWSSKISLYEWGYRFLHNLSFTLFFRNYLQCLLVRSFIGIVKKALVLWYDQLVIFWLL